MLVITGTLLIASFAGHWTSAMLAESTGVGNSNVEGWQAGTRRDGEDGGYFYIQPIYYWPPQHPSPPGPHSRPHHAAHHHTTTVSNSDPIPSAPNVIPDPPTHHGPKHTRTNAGKGRSQPTPPSHLTAMINSFIAAPFPMHGEIED